MNGFLLDENLPGGLSFQTSLPVSHALDLGANPTDSELWSFAKERRLVIVTKDADFSDRILVSSPPPWIVHLRFGNIRRKEFQRFLAAFSRSGLAAGGVAAASERASLRVCGSDRSVRVR